MVGQVSQWSNKKKIYKIGYDNGGGMMAMTGCLIFNMIFYFLFQVIQMEQYLR